MQSFYRHTAMIAPISVRSGSVLSQTKADLPGLPIGSCLLPILPTRSFLNFAAQTLNMNKWGLMIFFLAAALLFAVVDAEAQCSICTKTASQLGEKPAKALNGAIIYLMSTPLLIIGFIGWRWWKMQKKDEQ